MFEIFLALYFICCTGFFVFAIRKLVKDKEDVTLGDVIKSLYFSYIPGVNFIVAAVVLEFLNEKANSITLWKKKDDRP